MKKGILLCLLSVTFVSSSFAYTLTVADQTAIKTVIEKVQTKPIRTQEVVIKALKNAQNKTNFTEQKKAIFAAIESGLREKTSSGELLATSLERKEILQSVFTQTTEKKIGSGTLEVTGNLSSTVEPKKIVFDGSFVADVDVRDTENPKVRIRVGGALEADAEKVSANGEIRIVDRIGYMIVEKFSLVPDENNVASLIAPYLNIWLKFPLKNTTLSDTQEASLDQSQTNATAQKILLKKNVIPQLLYKGQTQGVSTYSGDIDTNAFIAAGTEILATQGEVTSESDIQDVKDALQGIKLQTQFSLDTKNTISDITLITQIRSKVLEDDSIMNGTVTIRLKTSPLIDPILTPKDAKNIDELIPAGVLE